MYINASSQATNTATFNATGDAALKMSQANEVIVFDALPFPNSVYGKHWFLGDKVSVKYKGHNLTPRVVMVTTTVDQQVGETITPGMATNV
jgi:archaellum component FlaF (FlaF/FlaG flagellin family)